jgi:hypothetical protein
MKRIGYCALSALCAVLVLMLVSARSSASDKLNFSGKYVPDQAKKSAEDENASTLEVVQSDDSVVITRVELGKKTVSHCPLNGSDGDYTSPGGVSGKCNAQLKPKYLMLESVVLTRPQQAASPVRMHTKEKWQLSSDAKTLTIKSDVDFPDFPADISAAVAGTTSGRVKYKRASP